MAPGPRCGAVSPNAAVRRAGEGSSASACVLGAARVHAASALAVNKCRARCVPNTSSLGTAGVASRTGPSCSRELTRSPHGAQARGGTGCSRRAQVGSGLGCLPTGQRAQASRDGIVVASSRSKRASRRLSREAANALVARHGAPQRQGAVSPTSRCCRQGCQTSPQTCRARRHGRPSRPHALLRRSGGARARRQLHA